MPVRLNGSTSGYTELTAPATAGNNTLTLPTGNGTSGQVLKTDGSGTLSWSTAVSPTSAQVAKAWVNFNGTSNSSNLSGTYSQSGTTVTVTVTNHDLIVGNGIYVDCTSGTGVDGSYVVASVTNSSTFTYTAGTSLTTSGNITLRFNPIRSQFNVSSITDNGVGDYTVNFTNALADGNYAVSGFSVANSATNLTGASMVTLCPTGSATYLPVTKTASTVRILTGNPNTGSATDSGDISFTVFR